MVNALGKEDYSITADVHISRYGDENEGGQGRYDDAYESKEEVRPGPDQEPGRFERSGNADIQSDSICGSYTEEQAENRGGPQDCDLGGIEKILDSADTVKEGEQETKAEQEEDRTLHEKNDERFALRLLDHMRHCAPGTGCMPTLRSIIDSILL